MPEIDYSAVFAAMPGYFCLLARDFQKGPNCYRIADLSSDCREIEEFTSDSLLTHRFDAVFECFTEDGRLPPGADHFVIEHRASQQHWHVRLFNSSAQSATSDIAPRLLQFTRRAIRSSASFDIASIEEPAIIRQALSAIESHVYVLDTEGRFLYVNRAILDLHGLDAEDVIGRSFQDLGYDKPLANKLMAQVSAAVTNGIPLIDQATVRAVDGSAHSFEYRWIPLRGEDGQITAIAGSTNDITARIRVQEELAAANLSSASASVAKSEFLANMSHEIRSPMTAILGFADILSKHLKNTDNLAAVDVIKRNGQHLLQVINDILDLSHIEAGRLTINSSRIEMDGLISDLHAVMLSQSRGKQIEISVECPELLPVEFDSDGKRLIQILTGLISNACKFTDSGSVTLRIEIEQKPSVSPSLLFAISDTGIGLTPDALTRAFEPFSQADSSHSRRYEGAGLGLPISQRLAEMLGGSISVDSHPGHGSCFSLRLPLSPSALEAMRRPTPRVHEGVRHHDRLSGLSCHLLIVDDRSDVRYVMQQMLEITGARVTAAGDGLEAISLVKTAMTQMHPFDLVLMDMQMPVMDGYEAAGRLRQLGYDRPILALTAAALQTDRERCLEAGCDDHLSKPIDAGVLVERIKTHLQQYLQREPPTAASAETVEEPTRLRVLLVEDNKDVRESTATLLRAAGCEVEEAGTGAETLEYSASALPDAIILDLGLPDMSGYDVADRVRELPGGGDCLIHVMSGRHENTERALKARIDTHLLKPVGWDEIRTLLGL